MRQWRVGTISMGLLLLGSGIGLLAAQFQAVPVAQAALRWWPLVFVVLGIEVLVYSYLRKEQSEHVKYDIFSILMILLLIFSGLGIKLFQEAGLAQKMINELESSTYNILLAEKEVALDQQVQKLVLSGGNCSNLEVRTTQSDSVMVSGDASIRARTRAEAQQRVDQNLQVVSRQIGSSLYIDLEGSELSHARVLIPSQLQVEVNASQSSISVLADQINNNWLIRGQRNTELTLPAQADVLLTVMGEEPTRVKGNLQWTSLKLDSANTSAAAKTYLEVDGQRGEVRTDSGNTSEIENSVYKVGGQNYQLQARLGNVTHRFTLISEGGELTVRQLP